MNTRLKNILYTKYKITFLDITTHRLFQRNFTKTNITLLFSQACNFHYKYFLVCKIFLTTGSPIFGWKTRTAHYSKFKFVPCNYIWLVRYGLTAASNVRESQVIIQYLNLSPVMAFFKKISSKDIPGNAG